MSSPFVMPRRPRWRSLANSQRTWLARKKYFLDIFMFNEGFLFLTVSLVQLSSVCSSLFPESKGGWLGNKTARSVYISTRNVRGKGVEIFARRNT